MKTVVRQVGWLLNWRAIPRVNKTQPQHQLHGDLDLPETLDTADAKIVYLYLRIENETTIDELQI